jgi:hypothetical protein
MLVSQKLAVAAHMHVLLRRKTGRVTDTEWMADNLEYALEVVRFARTKALEDGHVELLEWADKLEATVLLPGEAKAKPLVQTAVKALREHATQLTTVPAAPAMPAAERTSGFAASVFGASSFADSVLEPDRPAKPGIPVPRYVGGIR